MKIAITADRKGDGAQVDPRFGRAKYFAVCDTDSGECEYVDNAQNLNAMQGAGVQAAAAVAHTGAEVVITGNCGPKAFASLGQSGIKVVVGASGGVAEVLETFKRGEYEYADQSNVEGHW